MKSNNNKIYSIVFFVLVSLFLFTLFSQKKGLELVERSQKQNPSNNIQWNTAQNNQRLNSVQKTIPKHYSQWKKVINGVKLSTAGSSPTTGKYKAYLATQTSGIVGSYKNNVNDNPADNIFTVSLDSTFSVNDKVTLCYTLTGVEDACNASFSINDRPALGGYLIKKSTNVSKQRVEINPAWLKKGKNSIQFSTPENAGYGYKIENLVIEIEPADAQPFVVNSGNALYQNQAYIHGFIKEKNTVISMNGKQIPIKDGTFETVVNNIKNNTVTVTATLAGKNYTRLLRFKENVRADVEYDFSDAYDKTFKTFEKGKADILQVTNARLNVNDSSLVSTKSLSVMNLREIDVPAMDYGMTNVTAEGKGLRFLPHGEHFRQGTSVAIKYDRTKIPDGYTENDIKTYYFDNETKHWIALERDSIDKQTCMVVSKTTHFTDMINGVIKAPESPETQGFTPTMMNDVKAADPTSGIQLIAPPTANNRGSANLSYKIELPPARNGMSPDLTIQYNSDGGSGWLGEGWDLNVPTISVDTRWGVPRYDPNYETETYNLNGMNLSTIVEDYNITDTISISIAHRGKMYNRQYNNSLGGQLFFPNSENSFSRIIRKGNKPSNYYWEILDKNGIRYSYGIDFTSSKQKGIVTRFKYKNSNIQDGSNDLNKEIFTDKSDSTIAEWKLSTISDLHGSMCRYYYHKTPELINSNLTEKASAIYLDSICIKQASQNEFAKDTTYYKIEFKSKTSKQKQTFSARYGFFTSNNRLLDEVIIWKDKSKIRSYCFVYKSGPMGVDLLEKINQKDSSNLIVSSHDFNYYDNITTRSEELSLYGNTETTNIQKEDGYSLPALGGSHTKSDGHSIYVGGGFTFFGILNLEAGYNHGVSGTKSEKKVLLIDMNGDGLIDKVYRKNDGIYFMPNVGNSLFGPPFQVTNAINNFASTETRSTSDGWSGEAGVSVGVAKAGVNAGMDWSETLTYTPIYLSDVNNDGLVDIVFNGSVYFNKKDRSVTINGKDITIPTYTQSSKETINPIQYNMRTVVGKGSAINSDAALARVPFIISEEKKRMYDASPMQDMVRVWEAQKNGSITISGTCKLLPCETRTDEDGVTLSIQRGIMLYGQNT